MGEADAQASLARIEANVEHLAEDSRETRATVEGLRSDVQDLKVDDARRHERTASAVSAVDQRLERHEESDDRRFKGIGRKLDAMVPGAAPHKVRQVAARGGLLVGGGGSVLVILELLDLLRERGGG